uniref:Uncharacterized protein n=1 Tax=Sphaerodactylus townsendi TaxID=933632 RepID=A0ACB8GCG4_9SAUR
MPGVRKKVPYETRDERRDSTGFRNAVDQEEYYSDDETTLGHSHGLAPRQGVDAWRLEGDEMQHEIYLLKKQVAVLMARPHQDEANLPPAEVREYLSPQEGYRLGAGAGADPDKAAGQQALWPLGHLQQPGPGPLGQPMGPPVPMPVPQRRKLKAKFDGNSDILPYFLVQVETDMQHHGEEYENEADQIHDVGTLLEGEAAAWYMALFQGHVLD